MNNWSEKYEIGESSLDDHHKELFDLTTMLDDAIISNNPKNLEKIVLFLEHYASDHFAEEEELMIKKNYKGFNHHKNEHKKLSLLILLKVSSRAGVGPSKSCKYRSSA